MRLVTAGVYSHMTRQCSRIETRVGHSVLGQSHVTQLLACPFIKVVLRWTNLHTRICLVKQAGTRTLIPRRCSEVVALLRHVIIRLDAGLHASDIFKQTC